MKRFYIPVVAVIMLFAAALFMPQKAEATPAFARQTGFACNMCHYMHFPILNSFGRSFKAGNFTMAGGQSLIEGDLLSIPSALNAAIVTKFRYVKTNGDDNSSGDNKGSLQFPDEAALWVGGRIGENIGFTLEAQMIETDNPMFAAFRIPIKVYEIAGTKINVIPFRTDGAGPSYAFELLNTGANRMMRGIEDRKTISAASYVGVGGSAQGIALSAYNPNWFAVYSAWESNISDPVAGTDTAAGPYFNYARFAYTPTVNGWSLGAGVQYWFGDQKVAGARNHIDAWSVDAQAQGKVGGLPVHIIASYANAAKSKSGQVANMYNSSTTDSKTSFNGAVELGIVPEKVTIALGARTAKSGASSANGDNALLASLHYAIAQNVEIEVDQTWYSGSKYDTKPATGDAQTLIMMFAAF